MQQPFGVIPLSSLLVYNGKPTDNKRVCDSLIAHRLVRQSGHPNVLGCRIPVDSGLNIKNWRFYLKDFWDKQLVDPLEYGFPLDFDRDAPLMTTEENHASAKNFASDVQTYISEELKHGAMLGPFASKPIQLHISPFMTREKPESKVRCTIVDLSWPQSYSVNDVIVGDEYLGSKFLLQYPSVDDIVQKLNELGPGTLMFKVDISRAFRQLKVDPGDIDLLGLKQDAYFIDQSVLFGYRHGSIFFEKVTDSICYIMRKHGFNNLYNYVDEFFRDLNWFCTFLKQFNGVVYYDPRPIQAELHLDACLTGMGGILRTNVMPSLFPRISINIQLCT